MRTLWSLLCLTSAALACFPSSDKSLPETTTSTTTTTTTTSTTTTTTTTTCAPTGYDIIFMIPSGYMTKESLELLHDEFLGKFKIGRGPGEARFGGVLTNTGMRESFSLSTYDSTVRVKEALKGMAGGRFENLDQVARMTYHYVYPDFKRNHAPNRKKYRIIFSANEDNSEEEAYNRREFAMRGKNDGITTLVIPFAEASGRVVAQHTLDNDSDVYHMGYALSNLKSSKVLPRIVERIKSEACPIGGAG
ncbi:hypothetical protein QR680_004452 [Steinernema hermaphroditum]|uniref:Uncharacterized protein n=1 Tax=Steinernema hermaphroditum TaxID=289476 RepID=A0AA39LTP3_9BILA|nr:hypothetical protein QR680_004452 [Steinernema hermaphroditum]